MWLCRGGEFAGACGRLAVPLDANDVCIAAEADLWFEGLGFPHPVEACQGSTRCPFFVLALSRALQELGCTQAAS
jgi:hypothetical protein